MPFLSQFALSLEVTKIVPVKLCLAKSVEAVMSLARSLQNSGSDIVIEEEDLALLFGRCRISPKMESNFKVYLQQSGMIPPFHLLDGIALQSGAGPTVSRALQVDNAPYLSTVIRLSLLAWVHRKSSLAQAIVQTMEKRMEGAPPDASARALPSQENTAGVIRVCEDQTSAFDWNRLLHAVART